MNRENKLNGKWFIKLKKFETATDAELTLESCGRIIEEVSDGWFYVEIFGTGWNVVERRVISVRDLESACIYTSEIGFRDGREKYSDTLFSRERRQNAS